MQNIIIIIQDTQANSPEDIALVVKQALIEINSQDSDAPRVVDMPKEQVKVYDVDILVRNAIRMKQFCDNYPTNASYCRKIKDAYESNHFPKQIFEEIQGALKADESLREVFIDTVGSEFTADMLVMARVITSNGF